MKRPPKKNLLPLIIGAAAVIVCVIVLISIFSGKEEEKVGPTQGSVILNANAAVQIDYDASGKVTGLIPVNGAGGILLESISEYVNAPAADVVTQLLTKANEEGYMESIKAVVLRQTKGSQLPEKGGFLTDLQEHIQKQVGEGCQAVLITVDDLDTQGLIDFMPALELLKLHIGSQLTAASGGGNNNDLLGISATVDGVEKFYIVDGITGAVTEGNADEFFAGAEETFPTDPGETLPPQYEEPSPGYLSTIPS